MLYQRTVRMSIWKGCAPAWVGKAKMINPGLNVRWKMRNPSVLMLTFGGLCFFAAMSHADGYSPRVGQPHPDFTLPSIEGHGPISLAQFRGRKVLLIQFASW